ncbi:MAG: DinB family protein [Rhizobiaceae bacterium]
MIDPDYVRLMARYNEEMNARWLAAASRLDDAERRADRGAFFGSIHGTFNHILWADRVWLWRLAGADEPTHPRAKSASFVGDFEELSAFRTRTDREIVEWAQGVTPAFLAAPVTWFAGTPREFTSPQALRVAHMFNHQTHHRGQIHALLTGFGEDTAATDLWTIWR